VGLFAPLGAAYDAVGRWLVAHPAPQWVVNSPAKTKFTSFLASVLDPEFDLDASKAAVEKLIASDDVVVFSATYCPFSAAAKKALTAEGVPFTAVEWNETKGGAGFAPALAEITGRSSIPARLCVREIRRRVQRREPGDPAAHRVRRAGRGARGVLAEDTRREGGVPGGAGG
jgi:glutaredoxin 3